MPKITIYVPDELKAEMDAVESQSPNWSSIAQEAFSLECQRMKTRRKGTEKMEAVIERLRKSKERVENEAKIRGHARGRAWATQSAEFDQLERLAAWEATGEEEDLAVDVLYTIYGGADKANERLQHFNFWAEQGESDRPSDDFVWSFVEGAVEVYEEVVDKL